MEGQEKEKVGQTGRTKRRGGGSCRCSKKSGRTGGGKRRAVSRASDSHNVKRRERAASRQRECSFDW